MLHLLISQFYLADLGINEILKYISQGGVLGFLIATLYGGYKRWWVFGWIYRDSEQRVKDIERERDDWRQLALHGTNLAEQTVNLFREKV